MALQYGAQFVWQEPIKIINYYYNVVRGGKKTRNIANGLTVNWKRKKECYYYVGCSK